MMRLMLVSAGLPEPEINFWIHDRRGRFIAECDLVYVKERIVIEYEGDHHRTQKAQWRTDIRRREELEDDGWRVVRVTADDLDQYSPALMARIRRLLIERS